MDDSKYFLDRGGVRRRFEALAKRYEQIDGLDAEARERLLAHLEPIKIRPERILDVGSGVGSCASVLTQQFRKAQLIELDFAPAMLQSSRSRERRSFFSRRTRVAAAAERLPLRPHCIDLAYANLTLTWCDIESVLRELKTVLRPGGLIAMVTLGADTLKEVTSAWQAVDQTPHTNPFVDMHEIGDIMSKLGFTDIVLDSERLQLTYETPERLMGDLRQLGTGNQHQHRRRTLTGKSRLKAFKEQLLKEAGTDPLISTCELVYLHAWAPEQTGVALPKVTF